MDKQELVTPDDMRDVVIVLSDGTKAYGWWADDEPCGWRKYDNAYPVGNVDELQTWTHIQDNDDVIGWHEMNSTELTDTITALRAEVARLTAENERLHASLDGHLKFVEDQMTELQQAREATCAWTKNEDDWDRAEWVGDCGATWVFEEGGPVENEMGYCPNCGKRLVVLPTPPEQEADE